MSEANLLASLTYCLRNIKSSNICLESVLAKKAESLGLKGECNKDSAKNAARWFGEKWAKEILEDANASPSAAAAATTNAELQALRAQINELQQTNNKLKEGIPTGGDSGGTASSPVLPEKQEEAASATAAPSGTQGGRHNVSNSPLTKAMQAITSLADEMRSIKQEINNNKNQPAVNNEAVSVDQLGEFECKNGNKILRDVPGLSVAQVANTDFLVCT